MSPSSFPRWNIHPLHSVWTKPVPVCGCEVVTFNNTLSLFSLLLLSSEARVVQWRLTTVLVPFPPVPRLSSNTRMRSLSSSTIQRLQPFLISLLWVLCYTSFSLSLPRTYLSFAIYFHYFWSVSRSCRDTMLKWWWDAVSLLMTLTLWKRKGFVLWWVWMLTGKEQRVVQSVFSFNSPLSLSLSLSLLF